MELSKLFDKISIDTLGTIRWIAFIAFLILAIAAFFLTLKIIFKSETNSKLWGLLVIAMFLSLYVTLGASHEKRERESYAHIVECIESGYTLYINGEEVELSHITLENYPLSVIEVRDDIEEVHIAANK